MNTLDVQPIIFQTRAEYRAQRQQQRRDNWAKAGLAGGVVSAGLCCGFTAAHLDWQGQVLLGVLSVWGLAALHYLLRRAQ